LFLLASTLSIKASEVPDIESDVESWQELAMSTVLKDTCQINACISLAEYYLYDSTEVSKSYSKKGMEGANRLNLVGAVGRLENLYAMACEIQGQMDESLKYYESAFESLSAAGLQDEAAVIIVNMGVLQYYDGNRGEALRYYNRALAYVQQHGLVIQEAGLYQSIATLYEELKEYDLAVEMYSGALRLSLEIKDSMTCAEANERIGLVYKAKNRNREAVRFLKDAIGWYTKLNKESEAVQAELTLAKIYIQMNDLETARKAIDDLVSMDGNRMLPYQRAEGFLLLAEIEQTSNTSESALRLLDAGYELIDGSDRDELQSAYFALYAKIFESQGDFEKALKFTSQRMALAEALFEKDRITTEREVKAKFDLQQKEASLAIQEEKIMRRVRERQWFTALLVLAGVLLVLLTIFTISKSRSNKALKEKNLIIDKSLKEKEALLREIHHRVKNNLQVVSSLLSLQARSLKGQEALDALAKGKDRVRSMALIHQNLYQADHFAGVNSRDYIDRLCNSLLNTYNVGASKITLKTDVEPLLLDIDTVIPLGLILNELITNAIKYAFDPDVAGEISVSLLNNEGKLELIVADNGKGMEEGKFGAEPTMGYRLIKAFVQKLKGSYSVSNDSGTRFALSFNSFQLVKAC